MDIKQEIQEKDVPFLKLTEDLFDEQVKRGDHALSENPASASSWRHEIIKRMTHMGADAGDHALP